MNVQPDKLCRSYAAVTSYWGVGGDGGGIGDRGRTSAAREGGAAGPAGGAVRPGRRGGASYGAGAGAAAGDVAAPPRRALAGAAVRQPRPRRGRAGWDLRRGLEELVRADRGGAERAASGRACPGDRRGVRRRRGHRGRAAAPVAVRRRGEPGALLQSRGGRQRLGPRRDGVLHAERRADAPDPARGAHPRAGRRRARAAREAAAAGDGVGRGGWGDGGAPYDVGHVTTSGRTTSRRGTGAGRRTAGKPARAGSRSRGKQSSGADLLRYLVAIMLLVLLWGNLEVVTTVVPNWFVSNVLDLPAR